MLPNSPPEAAHCAHGVHGEAEDPTMIASSSTAEWQDPDQAETLTSRVNTSAGLSEKGSTTTASQWRQGAQRSTSNFFGKLLSQRNGEQEDLRVQIHMGSVETRQKYIIAMCRALMLFGAPTHRIEEHLSATARIIDIEAQFLYIPGCMIISFDHSVSHTAEVKILRVIQAVNLAKLRSTHEIYKNVLHDKISVEEALTRLNALIDAKNVHPRWVAIIMYGLTSASVSVFFQARLVDMPVIFLLGTTLGVLQLVVAPQSNTYSTVFEIIATVFMSFAARAIGSIKGGSIFCFSAIAQSSIASILPGWLILSSALELKSKAIVPGSIRLVFAIIHSLFLGYGITVGTALYGSMDMNATTDHKCNNPLNHYWNLLFVPIYVFFATHILQAEYKQMPMMILIAFIGYLVNFYSGQKFSANAPIAYSFGAFTVGILANLYSRFQLGVAAAVLLPAIYVQVPGCLASSGCINSALRTSSALIEGSNAQKDVTTDLLNSILFNVSAAMIQIAIGITVGLFMATLIVYPFGKKRSGLWTL